MAYPYQNYFPQNYPQYPQLNQMNAQQVQQTPQIQNGGFVPVRNIQEAREWHMAPNTSITFIDENAPYVYIKTRGLSQFEPPAFEKFKLVKEEDVTAQNGPESITPEQRITTNAFTLTESQYKAIQEALNRFGEEIESIKEQISKLKADLGEVEHE